MGVQIRKADAGDVDAIAAFGCAVVPPHYTPILGAEAAQSQLTCVCRALSHLQRSKDIADSIAQFEAIKKSEQLPLFVPEVRFHDGGHPIQVHGELGRGRGLVDGPSQLAKEVGDHRVILFECSQHGTKLGMSRLDRGKKRAVFAAIHARQAPRKIRGRLRGLHQPPRRFPVAWRRRATAAPTRSITVAMRRAACS